MRLTLIIIVGLGIIIGGFGLWFHHLVTQPSQPTHPITTLTVLKGQGSKEVADQLFAAGYIRARWHWNFYLYTTGLHSSILPGSYSVPDKASIRQLAKLVTSAPTIQEARVTLKEGWTADQMANELQKAGVITRQDFLTAAHATDSRQIVTDRTYDFFAGKPAQVDLEGFLFPDTYQFFVPSTSAQVLRKLLDNFNVKLSPDLRQAIIQQHRDIFEVITLASVLESELQTQNDRALAADLFLRRIEAGIPLQADATVFYALGQLGSKNALTNEDLAVDSPYNTYLHKGLPPGPISNPGLSAIRAAVHPVPNEYLYYLTAGGKTYFAKTLEEHNRNKAQYLR